MIQTRKMKQNNEEAFLADASRICCDQIITRTDDIDVLVSNYSNLFSLMIEKHAPMTVMRVSEKYGLWIDKDLKKLMHTSDKLKKAAAKTSPNSLWT